MDPEPPTDQRPDGERRAENVPPAEDDRRTGRDFRFDPSEILGDFLAARPRLAAGARIGPRAARLSGRTLRSGANRLRSRAFFLFQCSVSAAVALFIARDVLGHPEPFFAPIATLVALGQSFGQRIERVIEIVVGVAVGVFLGDLLVHQLGIGFWQLSLIVALAMAVTTLLGAGVLMTIQAGVQATFVAMVAPPPGGAFSRWIDALVGGLVALAAATITPTAPLQRPRQSASEVVQEMSEILRDTVAALQQRSMPAISAALNRARASETKLDALHAAADDGMAVVRSSPFRRGHLPAVQAIADLTVPLDRAVRNLRVLVRRSRALVRQDAHLDPSYLAWLEDLAEVTAEMAASLQVRRLPETAQGPLAELARATAYGVPGTSLSAEVVRAQVRSIVLDLLMVGGMPFKEALALVGPDLERDG